MKLLDHVQGIAVQRRTALPVPFRMPRDPADEPLTPRDAEDRPVSHNDERAIREKNLDKTLADSFPTSDPPSSIPDPAEEED